MNKPWKQGDVTELIIGLLFLLAAIYIITRPDTGVGDAGGSCAYAAYNDCE